MYRYIHTNTRIYIYNTFATLGVASTGNKIIKWSKIKWRKSFL